MRQRCVSGNTLNWLLHDSHPAAEDATQKARQAKKHKSPVGEVGKEGRSSGAIQDVLHAAARMTYTLHHVYIYTCIMQLPHAQLAYTVGRYSWPITDMLLPGPCTP